MGFPSTVANKALLACNRHCCICHKFCGPKIELHHIRQKAKGGKDSFDNCIPLCFDCHADMCKVDPMHPKGKNYTEEELRGHRDKWYAWVANSNTEKGKEIYQDDVELFQKICSVFDSDMQYWLGKADLNGLQPVGKFEPLSHLLYNSEDPFFEFLNMELEERKMDLLHAIEKFVEFNSLNTFPIDAGYAPRIWLYRKGYMRYEILMQNPDFQGSIENARKQFENEGKELNNLASVVLNTYRTFSRFGRRALLIR